MGNPIWKFRVLKSTLKMGKGVWSFVLFNDAWSQKGHSASTKMKKVISPTGKTILLVNLFCFLLLFDCFAGYMWIIKRYNGKVLTVNGFYALKFYSHSFVSSNSSGHKPLGKTEIPNSQLGISVIPTSPKQGISLFVLNTSLPKGEGLCYAIQ